jgi:redox-sensitive bicupin YhaK (pirin superfamily)
VPVRRIEGGEVRVYAGRSGEMAHPHGSDYPMSLLDIRLAKGARLAQETAPKNRGFLYVIAGGGEIGGRTVSTGEVAWYEPGDADELSIAADTDFRALAFAGEPINEPVVAYGPFVMSTKEEIVAAFEDYQAGRLVA